jgi:hypothetical protein
MLEAIWSHLQFDFWRGLCCLVAGLVVTAPCLLVPSWRRKILRSDIDLETIGLVALMVLLIAVGCYNYFDR